MLNILTESVQSATESTTSEVFVPLDAQQQLERAESFFSNLWDGFIAYIPTLITAVIIFVAGLLLSKLIIKLMQKGMKRNVIDKTVSRFMYSLVRIVLYVLLATVVLAVLGVPMSSIVAVVGTAGVAIGLALQNSLSNAAGGFNILFTKPFKIGDFIRAEEEEGTVEAINIWFTKILTIDNKTVFIPNGQLVSSKIINYTACDKRRVDMIFQISYDADFNKARDVLRSITDSHPKILDEPKTDIRMYSHSDSAIEIACRPWVKTGDYWEVYFDLNEQVKEAFDKNGIEIPYNQLDVHVKK